MDACLGFRAVEQQVRWVCEKQSNIRLTMMTLSKLRACASFHMYHV